MDNIKCKIMSAEDILENKTALIELMNIILRENITQCYPCDLAKQYILKLPKYIEDGSAIVIGAFDDKKLVGFHWCYYTKLFEENRIHSNFVGVLPKYQGYGIAQKMLKKIEKIAKENKVFIIEAMVTYNNRLAYKYHQNQGFEIERLKMRKVIK